MANEFPEKVKLATKMLTDAEKAKHREIRSENFEKGISILKDCLEEQPNNKKIRNIMKSYTRAILNKAIHDLEGLQFNKNDIYIDFWEGNRNIWNEYIVIFRKVKDIMEEIASEQPGLKDIKEFGNLLVGIKVFDRCLEELAEFD